MGTRRPRVGLLPLVALNAFLATTIVWSRAVHGSEPIPLSQARLATAGLAVGPLSHVGPGVVAGTAFLLFDENGMLVEGLPALAEVPRLAGAWLGMSLVVGAESVPVTFGVPIVLSVVVAIAVVFARADRADRDR